jgi:hypothetical protein
MGSLLDTAVIPKIIATSIHEKKKHTRVSLPGIQSKCTFDLLLSVPNEEKAVRKAS